MKQKYVCRFAGGIYENLADIFIVGNAGSFFNSDI
jgi:hypothetical protein